jgi:hypothetical protein
MSVIGCVVHRPCSTVRGPFVRIFLIHTCGTIALTTNITQTTADHLLSHLQTWGNSPRVLWIIIPAINGVIGRSCSPAHTAVIRTPPYPHSQHDSVDNPPTQVTVDFLLSHLQTWGNSPRVLWIIIPAINGVIHHSYSPAQAQSFRAKLEDSTTSRFW